VAKQSKGKITGNIAGIREMAKLPVNCTIVNANALDDVTPEEFDRRSAEAIRKLEQINHVIAAKNMDI
jgi:hypothetical protein